MQFFFKRRTGPKRKPNLPVVHFDPFPLERAHARKLPPSPPPRTSSLYRGYNSTSPSSSSSAEQFPSSVNSSATSPSTPSSPPRALPASPPNTNVRSSHTPHNLLVVGKQFPTPYITVRKFQIHPLLLRNAQSLSPLRHYALTPAERARGGIRAAGVLLEDLDPYAFELYIEYAATNRIEFPKETYVAKLCRVRGSKCSWQTCWPLINAHIFGVMVQDYEFADYVVDLLQEKLYPGQRADVETIGHLFTQREVSLQLRQLMVDWSLDGGTSNFRENDIDQYPMEYLKMCLQESLRRLDASQEGHWHGVICRYHLHGNENCYKDKTSGAYAKKLKNERERKKATKESNEAMHVALRDDIKITDWETKTNEQGQAKQSEAKSIKQRVRDMKSVENMVVEDPEPVALTHPREKSLILMDGSSTCMYGHEKECTKTFTNFEGATSYKLQRPGAFTEMTEDQYDT